jgi:hypothetical protein
MLVLAIAFGVPFGIAAALGRGLRWPVAGGLLLAVVIWLVSVLGGCNEDPEVECSAQPLVLPLFIAIYFLAPWMLGVGAGYLLRQAVRRARL